MKHTAKHVAKKRTIIMANWKMNPASIKDAEKLFTNIAKVISQTRKTVKKTEIVICPPFVYIDTLIKLSKKIFPKISSKISLGAQNSFSTDVGPFTGEVSPTMLHSLGVKYVIVGHSERRSMGETNELINKKLKSAINASLVPVLCVGERDRDENHEYFTVVKKQLEECLEGISKSIISKIIIAYEPIWAISTTPNQKNATPADSEEMVIFIKKTLADKFGPKMDVPRIIYGGSVNEKDAGDFLKHGGVDGLLAGKASLSDKKFVEIINIAEEI